MNKYSNKLIMKLKYLYLLLLFIVIVYNSCDNDCQQCDNYTQLFKSDTIPTITVTESLNIDSLNKVLFGLRKTNWNIEYVSYYLKYKEDSILVNTKTIRPNPIDLSTICRESIPEVLIHNNGTISFSSKIIPNTVEAIKERYSMMSQIFEYFFHSIEIKMLTEDGTLRASIDDVFTFMDRVEEVRYLMYEERAQKNYGKSFCRLSKEEAKHLDRVMKFGIYIAWKPPTVQVPKPELQK